MGECMVELSARELLRQAPSFNWVFGGDAPHRPDGCVAQGWSVAEVLRAYGRLREARAAT